MSTGNNKSMKINRYSISELDQIMNIEKIVHQTILMDTVIPSNLQYIQDQFEFHMIMKDTHESNSRNN